VPLYDYDCAACGRRFEVIHGVHDGPPEHCPLCGSGPVRKAFAAPAVHFKGSGWAKKERRAAVKSASSSGDGDKGSGDGDKRSGDGDTGSGGDGTSKASETSSTSPSSSSESGSTSSPASTSTGSGD
jgi:putative FmdB family regulatory protein